MDIEVIRLHEQAIIPQYQTEGAAALDLHACITTNMELTVGEKATLIPTGLAIHIKNPSIVGLIMPRSSYGHKLGLVCGNGVGVIDSDYQGPLGVSAWNRNTPFVIEVMGADEMGLPRGELAMNDGANIIIEPGDRIAQILFVPAQRVNLVEVAQFSEDTIRGEGGFGSTGRAAQ